MGNNRYPLNLLFDGRQHLGEYISMLIIHDSAQREVMYSPPS